jgi:Zn-dependent peptidase ImmA (M78 family)
MLSELTQEELSIALDAVAGEAIAALPDDRPPMDALALARALRLSVAWDEQQSGRGRIVRLTEFAGTPSRGSILLRPDPRPERLQWAVAHEIGELFSNRVFAELGVDPREAPAGARETVANQLAGRLLLPRTWFAEAAADCGWNILELKRQFATASHELIARRMLDFPPTIGITIFDNGRRTFRRGNLPNRMPPLVPLERAAWQQAHETGEPALKSDYHCHVQAWPIHEPEWKREILRTEWLAESDEGFE